MSGRLGLLLGALATALVLATAALAGTPVRATLTRALPTGTSAGQHVLVRWTLRDSAGRVVRLQHVVLTIICPTHDSTTVTRAALRPDGTYRANAVIPPGGIGTLSIKTSARTFLITNPFRR